MQSKDFVIEHQVEFLTNKGDFDYQPILVLMDNTAITGDDFIALSRMRRSRLDSDSITGIISEQAAPTGGDGVLVLHVGSTTSSATGIICATGTNRIRSQSVTADTLMKGLTSDNTNWTFNSTTSNSTEYTITTNLTSTGRLDIIVNDGENYTGDISLTGFEQLNDIDFIGVGFRPSAEKLPASGFLGASLALQYLFNREDIAGSSLSAKTVSDKSGNYGDGTIYGQGAGTGVFEDGSITGWIPGPIEGAFQFEGADTYIEAASSSAYTQLYHATSGMTLMSLVKIASTSDSQSIIAVGASSDTNILGISMEDGLFNVSVGTSKIAFDPVIRIGEWMHVAARFTATGDNIGTSFFLNGHRANINGESSTVSADMYSVPIVNDDATVLFGVDIDKSSSSLTGAIGVTRLFNRPMSDAEVFKNYISSVPGMHIVSNINIG